MRRILLMAMALLLLAGTAFTLDDDLSDFMFKDMVDTWSGSRLLLYPDLNLHTNPAVAARIDRTLVFPSLAFSTSNSRQVETIPAGEPQEGGSLTSKSSSFGFDPAGVEGYLPLEGGSVVGGSLLAGMDLSSSEQVDDNWSTANETITTVEKDNAFSIGLHGLFATTLDGLDLGGTLIAARHSDPAKEEFNQITGDPATTETYTTDLGAKYDSIVNVLGGTAGLVMNQETLALGIGVVAGYVSIDSSDGWIAVDKNGDTFAESIVSVQEQATSTDPWGGGLAYYDEVDREQMLSVALHPHLSYGISDALTFVGSGYWYPLSRNTDTFYTRTDATNQNKTVTARDSSLANFGLLGGVEWRARERVTIRSGVGYELLRTVFSQENLDLGGTSTFAVGNTNNYEEVVYAVDPNNEDIIDDAGRPTTATTQRVSLLAGGMWNPVPRIRFFSDAELGVGFYNNVYDVYNLTDDTVWTETDTSSELDWSLGTLVGFAFQLNENMSVGMRTGRVFSAGFGATSGDTLPSDLSGLTTNPGPTGPGVGTGNLEESNSGLFWLDIFVVLTL